ncbi:peptidase M16 [Salinibacter sp. 10B]|uniref:M16 family metallopeptidase n=1 Tax=Salinibacter sp. 10B TaxID=1923971 RepID=UPI000CF48E17|nr:pitrilysin family protein [Salinibacter sp. 10B]PQJ35784.1 peptidase M16 [Salinibacter sp. 10B]
MSTSSPNLASRVQDREAGPGRLLTLQTSVDDIVSWRGSFLAYPNLAAGDDLLQELTVSLLDKGTEQRDRFELARVLEDCGAKLNLSSDGLYIDVSGRALTEDLPRVMDVLAEMLRTPSFQQEEFEKAQAQALADVQRRMEKTSAQASAALTRRLFGRGHPNYSEAPETVMRELQQITLDDVRAYHAAHFGATEWTLAVVGDLEHDAVASVVDDTFAGWTPHDTAPSHDTDGVSEADVGRSVVPMPDKSNVDVRMGHAVPIRRDHDDYPALYVGNYILGGDFAARLMATVRDEKGLTYHIGSGLSGVSTRYSGYWQTSVTLSHDALEEGIAATKDVIRQFVEEGATEDELGSKKTTITGSYAVGLATTQRLAQSILTNAERGFDLDYLDRFPEEIEALTLDDVNEAVRTHLRPEAMHEALAGTQPEPVEV